jgi:hypothetical protein
MWSRTFRSAALATLVALAPASSGLAAAPGGPVPPEGAALPSSGRDVRGPFPPAHAELKFVPVPACLIINLSASTAIPANTQRGYYVAGTAGFPAQGGVSGGCGVPTYAKAVEASVTAFGSNGVGQIQVGPAGAPVAGIAVSFQTNIPNTASTLVPLAASGNMAIKALRASARVAVFVTGYYVEQIEGMISNTGTVYAGSTAFVSAVHNGIGNYTVTVDRDVTYCTPTVTAYSGYVYASAYDFNSNKVQVFIWYLSSGGTQTAYDGYFYLVVNC